MTHTENGTGLEPVVLVRVIARGVFLENFCDWDISIPAKQPVSFLSGRNGTGKTTILRALEGLFEGDVVKGCKKFSAIELHYSDNVVVEIENNADEILTRIRKAGEVFGEHLQEPVSMRLKNFIQQGYLEVLDCGHWRNTLSEGIDGQHLRTPEEAVQSVESVLPASEAGEETRRLNSYLGHINCRLVPANRLSDQEMLLRGNIHSSSLREQEKKLEAFWRGVQQELSIEYSKLISEAQRKANMAEGDLIRSILSSPDNASQELLTKKLEELEPLREMASRLSPGLGKIGEGINVDEFGPQRWGELLAYCQNSIDRLSKFSSVYRLVELFESFINEAFDRLAVSLEYGRLVARRKYDGMDLHLERLSSGEKHIILLAYFIFFKHPRETLILIDEPELSMHAAWKNNLVDKLEEVATLRGVRFLLATHSSLILRGRSEINNEPKYT